MWEGLATLLGFCLAMGVSSFLAGLLPLSFGLSSSHSRAISALGSGLLVGTCLIIIIPEGVETLYSAGEHYYENRGPGDDYPGELYEPHGAVSVSLIVGFILMFLIDRLPRHAASLSNHKKPLHISLANLSRGPHRATSPAPGSDEERAAMINPSSGSAASAMAAGASSSSSLKRPTMLSTRSFATTVGLVIHALADGIALAASTFIAHARTGFIVFIALMIHKAPAAFGLTSVLLRQGLTKRQARTHLLVFSLSAPVGAIATWLFVVMIIGAELGEAGTRFTTGVLLIFSGGTFLYVAMHTAQDLNSGASHSHSYSHAHHLGPDDLGPSGSSSGGGSGGGHALANGNPYAATPEHSPSAAARDKQGPTFQDTALGVTGMLLPLLAELGHAHH